MKPSSDKSPFLGLADVLDLGVIPPTQPMPEDAIRALQISQTLSRRAPGAAPRHDPELLARWYSKTEPLVIEEDEGDLKEDTATISFKGNRPDHLGFNALPERFMMAPRIQALLASEGLKTRNLTFDISSKFYPWTTIGAILRSYPPYTSEHLHGTGFMFGGRVMFTARHVFPENIHDSYARGERYRFVPAYDARSSNPEPFGSAAVTTVRGKKINSGSFFKDGFWGPINGWDYAACRLDNRIGDLCGSMGMACFGSSGDYKDPYYSSSGYPDFNNYNPLQEILIKVRDVDGGYDERELEMGNFAGPGWSGGPLFGYVDFTGDTRVVGVCSGKEVLDSFFPPYSNLVFAGGGRMIRLADYCIANWWD